MGEYTQFIGVILFTAVTFALLGVLLSALVVTFLGLREIWKEKKDGDGNG